MIRFAATCEAWLHAQRPRTRADCVDGPRPCPWYTCRYHLGVDVDRRGRVRIRIDPDDAPDDRPTCVLDVIDARPGGLTQPEIAEIANVTVARIHQIEYVARDRLRASLAAVSLLQEGKC